jgi:redox-sensitive bicupin YhaK (pirin superfamily)
MASEKSAVAQRRVESIIQSVPASDGAGVKLRRSLGRAQELRHDPFLMLDEFFSDNPDDYLAGFPTHPHRGFETVTYMLDGRMRHEDSGGNRGDLGPGDVQWMTVARGIIHSEMPQQTQGRMRGFQLWLNLPAAEKMRPAAYRDVPREQIPTVELPGVGTTRVIAGSFIHGSSQTAGPIGGSATEPVFLDVRLLPGASLEIPLPAGHNAFVYPYDGLAAVGPDRRLLPNRAAGLLSGGDLVSLAAGPEGAGLLLLAGRPLREPVVQYGPFVMNSWEEIERAVLDYQRGQLVDPPGT